MVGLISEEYAGHKIWFNKTVSGVEAKVSINGIWYMTIEGTKRESFHKMKILIVDVLKKGNFQKHKSNVLSSSFNDYADKYNQSINGWKRTINQNNRIEYSNPNNNGGISIYFTTMLYRELWFVSKYGLGSRKLADFDTKEQAIDYAKKYMRSHS